MASTEMSGVRLPTGVDKGSLKGEPEDGRSQQSGGTGYKKMRKSRSLLLFASAVMIVLLLGGGLAMRVAATESSYRQAVLFAEVLSRVLETYVDPVEVEQLLEGAYEGMLSGLDPNGAYLTAQEVSEWKLSRKEPQVDPGFTVLKHGRTVQVAAVEPGSPAADAGIAAGDHIRSIDGQLLRDLSLEQSRRLLRGRIGSSATIELLHPEDAFRRENLQLVRTALQSSGYELSVQRGTAVLALRTLGGIAERELSEELDDIRSRGVDRLLLDLRNLANGEPRQVGAYSGMFAGGMELQLRDRSGRLIETVASPAASRLWPGSLSVLVNGATAGGAEALALLIQAAEQGRIYGEETYGHGAEAKLFELEDGSALLVSAAVWETASGERWNIDGVKPDQVVNGEGEDIGEVLADQLDGVLGILDDTGEQAKGSDVS
jgi:carboxyl-terminal processing protease